MDNQQAAVTAEDKPPERVSTLLRRFERDRSFDELNSDLYLNIVSGDSDAEKINARKNLEWDSFIKNRGSRYEDCRLENFHCIDPKQLEAIEQLNDFVSTMPFAATRNVILLGPSGTGKDHVLVSLVRHAIKFGVLSVGWTSGPSLFS